MPLKVWGVAVDDVGSVTVSRFSGIGSRGSAKGSRDSGMGSRGSRICNRECGKVGISVSMFHLGIALMELWRFFSGSFQIYS